MTDDILQIIPHISSIPPNEKVFCLYDPESGEPIGEKYSYNDFIKMLENISGVSEDLLGENAD